VELEAVANVVASWAENSSHLECHDGFEGIRDVDEANRSVIDVVVDMGRAFDSLNA